MASPGAARMLLAIPALGSLCAQPARSGRRADWAGWASLSPIGHIESCFSEKFATPRQGSLVPDAPARLRLDTLPAGMSSAYALEGLEAYSHVWLLWAAHLNGHDATQAKVKAPRLRGGRAGVYATRSPFRPNPIGLSLVRLRAVEADTLLLSGVDLVSGTPVLDVKPYIPAYDAPQPEDGAVRTAEWVNPPSLPVRFAPAAAAALAGGEAGDDGGGELFAPGRQRLLPDAATLERLLVQALAADPRPLYRWRREQQGSASGAAAEYELTLDGVRVRCRFEADEGGGGGESVIVLSICVSLADTG